MKSTDRQLSESAKKLRRASCRISSYYSFAYSALASYQDFFTFWKDADPDIPILRERRELMRPGCSAKEQAHLTVIRARADLVRARTALVNTARDWPRATASGCNVLAMAEERSLRTLPRRLTLGRKGGARQSWRKIPRVPDERLLHAS